MEEGRVLSKFKQIYLQERLRVFENRIMRSIFGLKRDANGEWSRLHGKELHSLYRSPNIVRELNLEY